MSKTLLKNGRLICPSENLDMLGHIIIEGDHIASVVTQLPNNGDIDIIIDCNGCVIMPGAIDMRVQSADPGAEHLESLSDLLAAAGNAGITQLVSLPATSPVIDSAVMIDSLKLRASSYKGALFHLYGAMTQSLDNKHMAELGMMAKAGAVGFANSLESVSDSLLMRRIMTYSKMLDKPIIHHCSDPYLSKDTDMNESETAIRLGLIGEPSIAETIILERDLNLVSLTGCRYHAAHISTASSIETLRLAKRKGLPVTADTSPAYFLLNDKATANYNTSFRLNPPLRDEADRLAIIDAIADGTIDAIASDHHPIEMDRKMLPFGQAASGAAGVETLLPLAFSLFHTHSISLTKIVNALSVAPAKTLSLPIPKLAIGTKANITIVKLSSSSVIRVTDFMSQSQITPFEHYLIDSKVAGCFVNGISVTG